ncbi:MAG: hypothetical protein IH621_18390 [Krumholzibacteria bacterium]|nr:hypothetical protein [Candidatus Krumholzibacteria bacterium]
MAVDESLWREYRATHACSKCGAKEWYTEDGKESYFCGPCERATWVERFRLRKNLPGELGMWLTYIWIGCVSVAYVFFKIMTKVLHLGEAAAALLIGAGTVVVIQVAVVRIVARFRWREEQNRRYGFGGWREIK